MVERNFQDQPEAIETIKEELCEDCKDLSCDGCDVLMRYRLVFNL